MAWLQTGLGIVFVVGIVLGAAADGPSRDWNLLLVGLLSLLTGLPELLPKEATMLAGILRLGGGVVAVLCASSFIQWVTTKLLALNAG